MPARAWASWAEAEFEERLATHIRSANQARAVARFEHRREAHIARLTPPPGSQRLVGRKIENVQAVAEDVVPDGREKPEVAVAHPFQLRAFSAPLNDRAKNARFAPQPLNDETVLGQQRRIGNGGARDAFFAVVKDVDVTGETRTIPIEGARPGDIVFGTAARRQQQQNFALELRERHDTPLLSAPPADGISYCLPAASFRR
jgi:hypothetical protein